MAAYRRVYDSRHPQADCQEPGSAPEPCARQSSTGCLYFFYFTSPDCRSTIEQWNCGLTADRNRNSQTPRHTTQQSFLCHSRYALRGRPDDAAYMRGPILCASLSTSFRLQFSARIHRITFRRGNITAAALSRYFIRTVLQHPRVQ